MNHQTTHNTLVRALLGLILAIALTGAARANVIQIQEEVTATHSITITTTTPKDSAEVEITGGGWTGSMSVFDGHPSVANVTAPRSPWGGPYARGKAFGDGDSGETWTAFMADANGPDTYSATTLKATASKTVTVQNLTTTTRTIIITTIFLPEFAAVAYDDGVLGDLGVIYRLMLNETTSVYTKHMTFTGAEVGFGSVIKDGINWQASPDGFVPNLGGFDNIFIMDSAPIEIPVELVLQPNETIVIELSLDSEIVTPDPAATTGMGFLGATSNSLPLDLYEPNDDPSQATILACGDALFEPVLAPGDIDHFLVDAPFGTVVDVIVESSQPLFLSVLDPTLAPLANWPLPATSGASRRYIATGGGDVLAFFGELETFFTVFISCEEPTAPVLPGDLFGVTTFNSDAQVPELVRLDPLTGQATFQAPLSGPFGDITDIVFDPFRGLLIGAIDQAGMLVDIDPITGLQFVRCQYQPFGQVTAMTAGPDGILVSWVDEQQQPLLGILEPQPTPQGICQIQLDVPLNAVQIGGLAFDPLNNLLFGCTGPFDPQPGMLFAIDLPTGTHLPPQLIPPSCGGLELMQQGVIIGNNRGGVAPLVLVTGPDDAMPGMLFAIDRSDGTTTPIGDTGTGGIVSLARVPGAPPADSDGDGVPDPLDNCLFAANPTQTDADGDGLGNRCDADLNQDCVVNAGDLGALRTVFFSDDPVADFNDDGVVNVSDLGILRASFFATPGPSGTPNLCTP